MAQLTQQFAPQQYPLPGVLTTGASATEILRIDMPTDSVLVLEYTVTGQRVGTFGRAVYTRRVIAQNSSGTVTVVVENAIGTDYNPNTYGTPSHAAAGSGTPGLVVSVTGASATNIKWSIAYRAIL